MVFLAFCSNTAMEISDTWDAHLRALVDRLAPGEGRGVKRAAYREIAAATRMDEEYVYQVYTGRKKTGQDFATALARAYADGRDLTWINVSLHPAGVNADPPAQLLSESSFKIPQKPLSLGELRVMKKIPTAFEVVLSDDAMAPEFPIGTVVKFRAGTDAVFGNRVLLRDRTGELHFREYAQNFDGEPFEGHATGRGFADIKPRQHGASVIAIKTGYYVEGA